MKIPKNRSIWLYVGKPPGRNMPHMVIDADPKEETVTTWSSFDKDPTNGGYSWHGKITDFFKQFEPAQEVGA